MASVSSGEETVAYIQDRPADVIVLDMIMPPGMHGLDTYRQLIRLHPAQKAIVTSGFSETDRVKKAQRLGAGRCIKKPYSMEAIAEALRDALRASP